MAPQAVPLAPNVSPETIAALRAAPLLQEFTEVGIGILAEAVQRRTVGRGTYAFRAGEPSGELLLVARGKLLLLAREGGSPLGEVGPGDALGGFSLLSESEHLVTAQAPVEVELLVLTRTRFEQLHEEKPGAALKLLVALAKDLGQRLREARAPLREFLSWQVSKRQAEPRR
jgi:CRP-like cAMP-binding protein